MKDSFVSVIIPAFNAEKTVESCIRSLLNQQYPKSRYEIIVIDNGSTDNTLKILQKFRRTIRILNEGKRGSYAARNKGIKHVKGDIIAFTDSDCIADKNWLQSITNAFQNKLINLVGGNIKSFRNSSHLLRYCNKFCHSQKYNINSTVPFFTTANMAVKKEVFNMQIFNDALHSGGDVEFCSGLIKNKDEVFYEPSAVVWHRYDDSIIRFIKKHYYYGKGQRLLRKNLRIKLITPMPNYINILLQYDLYFIFFRILQDTSYLLGLHFGPYKKLTTIKNI